MLSTLSDIQRFAEMAGDSNPQERPYLQLPARAPRSSPLHNMRLHRPTPETRLAPLVVDVESESVEIPPQLAAVEPIPGYHRSSASSSSRAGSSHCQPTAAGSSSEVICLDDSPTRPSPSPSRSESSARKIRRLNNDAPVIVVDDEDDVVPVPRRVDRDHRPAAPPAPPVVPRVIPSVRRLARADSGSSIRPFRSRVRSTDRVRRYRASGSQLGTNSDDPPPNRDMPMLNNRTSHIRVPVYPVPNSSIPRPARSSHHTHAPVPPAHGATTSRVAALLSTLGYAHVNSRSSFARSGSSRPMNIGVHVATGGSRARRSFEQEMLASIVQHIAQSGGVPIGVEFRYVTEQSLDYESLVRLDEQLVRQRNAAPKNVINSLPEVVATEADVDIRCVVCMCDVEVGEKLRALPCGHKFHKKCIDEWFTYNGACPIDKKRICDFQPARPPGSS